MGTTWTDSPREPHRVISMRFEVDPVEGPPDALERLARLMESFAVSGARHVGALVRERRLYVDRHGDMREIATLAEDT